MEDEHKTEQDEYSTVKSTAVVKHSAALTPANFARLQCNTDLNLPPSNWLSSSADSYGLQHCLSHTKGFSSFRMAHMFPDCVGDVDVVSDAENIKKLLKLAYSNDAVSMMVHRIENTLLIDDFDIHKHLLRTAETEWNWLKKFFYEHIQNTVREKKTEVLYKRDNSRYALEQKKLMSKFLYRSLIDNEAEKEQKNRSPYAPIPLPDRVPSNSSEPVQPALRPCPALPEPRVEEEVPDPAVHHKHNRNVLWTFEDIQMLIGTDMPIFGGSTHPCISLRLRDMNKPINVLTGVDYWLDNLMSNVPEVVMCYHLNGIVQKYEFIKTEDLPYLESSKFSPKLIRDIAQNILSFLKSNATKAGHTYWLLKGRNDDVVKLYDLTSLCSSDMIGDRSQNPFTVPVAMLLYRVARNMKQSGLRHVQSGTLKILLKNCLKLLDKEKYPQITTSSHYMLADLYVPAGTDPSAPGFKNTEAVSEEYEDDEGDGADHYIDSDDEVKQLHLNDAKLNCKRIINKCAPPISGPVVDRCLRALRHVAMGLKSLQDFPCQPESDLKMTRPNEPIPMPYVDEKNEINVDETVAKEKPKRSKKKKSKHAESTLAACRALQVDQQPTIQPTIPTWQEPEKWDDASWYNHLKTLLYEKACLIYATLAEQEFTAENYGSSLRYIKALVHCQSVFKTLHRACEDYVQEGCLLARAGDCYLMIEKSWDKFDEHQRLYTQMSADEEQMMRYIRGDPSRLIDDDNLFPDALVKDQMTMLVNGRQCYKKAYRLKAFSDQNALCRRLGNILNELGTFCMNVAVNETDPDKLLKLLHKSLEYLEEGIATFEKCDDAMNLALMYSNMGRLMRLRAHVLAQRSGANDPQQVHISTYNKAMPCYNKALEILGNRRAENAEIWDVVMWELSTTTLGLAVSLQDNPRVDGDDEITNAQEQEVAQALLRALECCDLKTRSYRLPIYQYRAARIHSRLASLYHRNHRVGADAKKKMQLKLCELHYRKSLSIFLELEHCHIDLISVALEYLALHSDIYNNSASASVKFKSLCVMLTIFVKILPVMRKINEKSHDKDVDKESNELLEAASDDGTSYGQLMKYTITNLQFVLLHLIKHYSKNGGLTEDARKVECFKSLYAQALKVQDDDGIAHVLACLVESLERLGLNGLLVNFNA